MLRPGVCVAKGATIANCQRRAFFATPGRLCPERRHYREFSKTGFLFKANRRRHRRLLRPGACALKGVTNRDVSKTGSCSKRIVVDIGVCYAPGVCVWKGVSIANFQKRVRVQKEWSSPSAFATSGRLCPEGRHYREFPILFNAIRRRHRRLCYARASVS